MMDKRADVLVEAYFHINNGGLTVGADHETHIYPSGKEYRGHYVLRLGQSGFGIGTEFRFPLNTIGMVDDMIEILRRVRAKMALDDALQERVKVLSVESGRLITVDNQPVERGREVDPKFQEGSRQAMAENLPAAQYAASDCGGPESIR